jgi:hypothetical protein
VVLAAPANSQTAYTVAIGDLDGGGLDDVAFSGSNAKSPTWSGERHGAVWVFPGAPDGATSVTDAPLSIYGSSDDGLSDFDADDVDADGNRDLVVGMRFGDKGSLFYGPLAPGVYDSYEASFSVRCEDGSSGSVELADADGDGFADLFFGIRDSYYDIDGVAVFFGATR